MIYLDHNATTPTLPEVTEAMLPYLSERWGNPSSAYRFGAGLQHAIAEAGVAVANFVGCDEDEIIFTSGATEANNTAIHSGLLASPTKRHLITSRTEHSSVLAPCEAAVGRGASVTYLPVDRDGQVDLNALHRQIRPDTALVSLMWANNETGVITPIKEVAAFCEARGVLFHCDAVQVAGKLQIAFNSCGANYLTISGHKFGAPKGVGALIVRRGSPFSALITGGKQQEGRRGGTENVPQIVALGVASDIARIRSPDTWESVQKIRNTLEEQILSLPGAYRNGTADRRLPNTLNFGIRGIDSDALVAFFDRHNIAVSSGAACMESAVAPSHVILAMGDYQRANEALRISLGLTTLQSEIDRFWELLRDYVNRSAIESTAPYQSSKESLSRTS